MRHLLKVIVAAMTVVTSQNAGAVEVPELNTILMGTTFQILGPSKHVKGASTTGTGFIVVKQSKDDPNLAYFVLVTAAHVLQEIEGDSASINVREKQTDGTYKTTPFQIQIRNQGKDVYVTNPAVDVVAMYVSLPQYYQDSKPVGEMLLASDEDLVKYNVHPGDDLNCLGYPLSASGPYGFPILRSGKIASYPLVPARDNKNWLFDFRVFPGNSGGPVYLIDHGRTYPDGSVHIGETLQILVGLVTQQMSADVGAGPRELQLGVVIPALFIKETIDMLPAQTAGQK